MGARGQRIDQNNARPEMTHTPIGGTNLPATRIAFGTAALGGMYDTYGHDVDEEFARSTVNAIFDGPANVIDTSRNYGSGRSEARIGAVIRERGGLPGGFIVSTKLDRDMDTGRFDAARARRSFEESLDALSLERVQVLHLHDPEHAADLAEITQPGGALDELFRIKDEGLADAVGLAMGRIDIMLPLIQDRPFDVILNHNRFSLLNRSANELFDVAHGLGIAIWNAAPFAGGVLAKGSAASSRITYQEVDKAALAPVRDLEKMCLEFGVPLGALALQFSMRDPRIATTVIGVSRPERVAATVEWAGLDIADELWDQLENLGYSTADPEAYRRYQPG
jgi:D-threo-aldose 1-dehydrogenase